MEQLERLIIEQALANYENETNKVKAEIKFIIDRHLKKYGLDGRVVSLSITTNTIANPKEFPQHVSFINSDKAKQIIAKKAVDSFLARLEEKEKK